MFHIWRCYDYFYKRYGWYDADTFFGQTLFWKSASFKIGKVSKSQKVLFIYIKFSLKYIIWNRKHYKVLKWFFFSLRKPKSIYLQNNITWYEIYFQSYEKEKYFDFMRLLCRIAWHKQGVYNHKLETRN